MSQHMGRDQRRVVGPGDVVAVTGAAGGIGHTTARTLVAAGLRVVAVDRRPADGVGAERALVGDLRDPEFAASALTGPDGPVDAVVHLAAILAPGIVPDDQTLIQNVHTAYLVLEGAGHAGARTAVAASSVSWYGYAWAGRELSPPRVPLDEAQPTVAVAPYEGFPRCSARRWGRSRGGAGACPARSRASRSSGRASGWRRTWSGCGAPPARTAASCGPGSTPGTRPVRCSPRCARA
ncbi:NAD(P)-dependent oxidoreductase [Streptomyces sp. PT12]|uniref:NAD-dependent epimerase/dehydratase family protein n=1 Tax=Streptomyces sp. PT12 TaxID=1510197 RepID=UPI0015EEFB49|nr:NAD(P)-dependent oxidoreductase [Streptomyces sp. PT12]